MELIIKRSKWLRGEPSNSWLIREGDNKQCCLGFLGQACKIPKEQLLGNPSPEHTFKKYWPAGLINRDGENSKICWNLMRTNDSKRLKDPQREKSLKKQFKKIGINVKFVS